MDDGHMAAVLSDAVAGAIGQTLLTPPQQKKQFQSRTTELEPKNAENCGNVHVDGDDVEQVDKSVAVLGGEKREEAEALVQQMMVSIAGRLQKRANMIDGDGCEIYSSWSLWSDNMDVS